MHVSKTDKDRLSKWSIYNLISIARPKNMCGHIIMMKVTILLWLTLTGCVGDFSGAGANEFLKTKILQFDGSFHVNNQGRFTYITLVAIDKDSDLKFFDLIPNDLRRLTLKNSKINLQESAYEGNFKGLEFLVFRNCDLGVSTLSPDDFCGLEGVTFDATEITEDLLGKFSSSNLKKIVLVDSPETLDRALGAIAEIHSLEEIILANNRKISGRGVNQFASLPKLQRLSFRNSDLSGLDLSDFKCNTSLEHLDLNDSNIDSKTVNSLSHFSRLRVLALGDTRISDDCVKAIRCLKSLEVINLTGTAITADSLKAIGQMPSLKQLMVSNAVIQEVYMPEWTKDLDLSGKQTAVLTRTKEGDKNKVPNK